MKILHLAPLKSLCGIWTYAFNLHSACKSLHQSDIAHFPSKEKLQELNDYQIKKELVKLCRLSANYDVVHVQCEWGLLSPGGVDKGVENYIFLVENILKFNQNTCITFHTEPTFILANGVLNHNDKLATKIWRKKALNIFNRCKCIVHSKESRQAFIESGLKSDCLYTITHGVLETRDIKKINNDSRATIVSMFGHIAPYKGLDLILDVLQLLPLHYKFCIIGGRHPHSRGNEIEDFLLKIKNYNLQDRVLITGSVSMGEADYYHSNSHVVVAPHQAERLSASGAITWSLTSQRPVIGSNINAFRNIVSQEPDALLLCNKTAIHEWAWAIQRCATDELLKNKLIKGAQQYCSRFSWSNIAIEHVKLYTS